MPAFFVHGVPDTATMWDGLRSHLTRTDVIAPNLPGFDAPLPAGWGATKEEYVDWVIGGVEKVGEPVDLVGHDWGSIIVLRVTSVRPDLVRTLACGNGPIDREYKWHDMAQMWQTPDVGEQVMEAMTPEAIQVALAPEMGEARAVEAGSHIDATMKDCILKLYRSAVNVGAEWHDDVDAITTPTLVLWGRQDAYVPPEIGERIAQRTHARLVMFETGHWWPVACAGEAARELESHWSNG